MPYPSEPFLPTLPGSLPPPALASLPAVSVTHVGTVEDETSSYLNALKSRLAMNTDQSDYDANLLNLLATALDAVETYTGLSLQPKTVTVSYSGYDGGALPQGPVWDIPVPVLTPTNYGSTVTINSGLASNLSGGLFPTIVASFSAGTASYSAGYSNREDAKLPIPSALVGAILEHAASSFRNGNLTGGKPDPYWKALAGPKRRFS